MNAYASSEPVAMLAPAATGGYIPNSQPYGHGWDSTVPMGYALED